MLAENEGGYSYPLRAAYRFHNSWNGIPRNAQVLLRLLPCTRPSRVGGLSLAGDRGVCRWFRFEWLCAGWAICMLITMRLRSLDRPRFALVDSCAPGGRRRQRSWGAQETSLERIGDCRRGWNSAGYVVDSRAILLGSCCKASRPWSWRAVGRAPRLNPLLRPGYLRREA